MFGEVGFLVGISLFLASRMNTLEPQCWKKFSVRTLNHGSVIGEFADFTLNLYNFHTFLKKKNKKKPSIFNFHRAV